MVYVEWAEKNFSASLGDNVPGAVVIAAKDINELKREVEETLRFHVEGMLADGDDVPQWLANGIRHPRPEQRQRIIDGIHEIGKELLSVV